MMGRKKVKGAELQTRRFSAAMITPTVIVLAVMTAYPLIFTLVYSFTDYNLLGALNSAPEVVGAKNYLDLLTDPYFQQSVWNTVKFTVLTVILEMLIGFGAGTVRQQSAQRAESHENAASASLSASDGYRGSDLADDAVAELRDRQSGPGSTASPGLQLVFPTYIRHLACWC